MKSFLITLFLGLVATVLAQLQANIADECHKDDCLRRVSGAGVSFPLTSRQSMCESLLAVTTTPAETYVHSLLLFVSGLG